MKIELEHLRAIFTHILSETEKYMDSPTFDLKLDYYWRISQARKYDPQSHISTDDLSLGRVVDDLHEIERVLEDSEAYIPQMLYLLSEVLQAMGAELDKHDDAE